MQRNTSQAQLRVDSYDGNRESLDINRVLKKDVLAIRGSAVYQHDGFWFCMDTPRDYQQLSEMWSTGRAPWAVWDGHQ